MKMNEKDCTDQLTECHVSCDTNDKECISECIEDYHECDTKEFTAEDVDNASLTLMVIMLNVLTTWSQQ